MLAPTIPKPDTIWKPDMSTIRNPDTSGFLIPTVCYLLLSGGSNTKHWNTKPVEVRFSKGPKTRWLPFCFVFQWSGPWITNLSAGLDYFISTGKIKWIGGPFKYRTFWPMNRLLQSGFQITIWQPDTNLPFEYQISLVLRWLLYLFECTLDRLYFKQFQIEYLV